MTHTICRECETQAHCMAKGCIPIQLLKVPTTWPVIDADAIPAIDASLTVED